MYENNTRLSLKMFQQNHSFTFIEDKETPVTGKTRCWTRGTSLSTKVPLPMRRS